MTQIQFNNALFGLKDKLFFYALSLTSDKEKANDLIQETFLKALTYRKKFKQNTNFKAWIYTIMRNNFINDYRRNVKRVNIFSGSNSDFHLKFPNINTYPAPDTFYNSKEIDKSINALKDEYRIPFTMFISGFKYKEIAEKLDLPLGTVKSRIFFSRKILKNNLKEYATN